MIDTIMPQLHIDKHSAVPIYRQLQQQLETLIKAGTWHPREPLPSETVLAQRLNISVMTVRQAMANLVSDGLVYREKGRGTFVAPQPLIHPLQRLESFTEDVQARGLNISSQILAFEICSAPDEVAEKLQRPHGSPVLHIKRLRLVDDRPAALHQAYLTQLDLEEDDLIRVGSLYRLLEEQGIKLAEAEENLDAIVADTELAALLKVSRGAPLLQVARTTWNQHHVPIEVVWAIYRANFYRYTVKLYR